LEEPMNLSQGRLHSGNERMLKLMVNVVTTWLARAKHAMMDYCHLPPIYMLSDHNVQRYVS
jgi:hypothetical protein